MCQGNCAGVIGDSDCMGVASGVSAGGENFVSSKQVYGCVRNTKVTLSWCLHNELCHV